MNDRPHIFNAIREACRGIWQIAPVVVAGLLYLLADRIGGNKR